jgi:hypothetical protein
MTDHEARLQLMRCRREIAAARDPQHATHRAYLTGMGDVDWHAEQLTILTSLPVDRWPFVWRTRTCLPEYKGWPYRVLAESRRKKLVQFPDGRIVLASIRDVSMRPRQVSA